MTKKIKAIAFDLDGLMVNTEDVYDQVCDILLEKRGHQFTRELKLMMMGRPGPEATAIMKRELDLQDSVTVLQEEVQDLFHEIMPNVVQRLPGLCELLQYLEEKRMPLCVATSSFRRHATSVLTHCELHAHFDFVLTCEDVNRGKPDPEIYLLAADKHQVSPKEMLVLEDSVQGSKAGAASGAVTVAVPGSHSIGCDYGHVEHVAESLHDPLIYELLER